MGDHEELEWGGQDLHKEDFGSLGRGFAPGSPGMSQFGVTNEPGVNGVTGILDTSTTHFLSLVWC